MKTIADVKQIITDKYLNDQVVIEKYGVDPAKPFDAQFSAASLESVVFYIQAFVVWSLVKLFDLHKTEVTTIIDDMKPHTARWYAKVSRAFQFGFNLLPDSDKYDNVGHTPEEIAASKIIAYAAVMEIEETRMLKVKVAKDGGDLTPLSSPELLAFKEYMKRVKDAGVFLDIISESADLLALELKVYYNPLVLNSEGKRVDETNDTPVKDAVNEYLKNMPFNGWVSKTFIVDALQTVDGVVIPHISKAQFKYGALGWQPFEELYLPEAGYMRLDDLKVTYIAQSEIK